MSEVYGGYLQKLGGMLCPPGVCNELLCGCQELHPSLLILLLIVLLCCWHQHSPQSPLVVRMIVAPITRPQLCRSEQLNSWRAAHSAAHEGSPFAIWHSPFSDIDLLICAVIRVERMLLTSRCLYFSADHVAMLLSMVAVVCCHRAKLRKLPKFSGRTACSSLT